MSGRDKSEQDGEMQSKIAAVELGASSPEPAQEAALRSGPPDPAQQQAPMSDTPREPAPASTDTPAGDLASKDATAEAQAAPETRRRAKPRGGYLDRTLQARIGSILRDSFADIEREPLPERLQELIKALKASDERG